MINKKINTETEEELEPVIVDGVVVQKVDGSDAIEEDTSLLSENPSKKIKWQDKKSLFGSQDKGFRKNVRAERQKSEFDQKVLSMRRVTRVTGGGKRFNISLAVVVGDGKGKVGVGTGKGLDTTLALEKAVRNAKKNLLKINLTKSFSIPHDVQAKYSSSIVLLMPAPRKGLIAGSAVRDVLQIAGVLDVSGKILSGSKNKLNIGRATIKALSKLLPVKEVKK